MGRIECSIFVTQEYFFLRCTKCQRGRKVLPLIIPGRAMIFLFYSPHSSSSFMDTPPPLRLSGITKRRLWSDSTAWTIPMCLCTNPISCKVWRIPWSQNTRCAPWSVFLSTPTSPGVRWCDGIWVTDSLRGWRKHFGLLSVKAMCIFLQRRMQTPSLAMCKHARLFSSPGFGCCRIKLISPLRKPPSCESTHGADGFQTSPFACFLLISPRCVNTKGVLRAVTNWGLAQERKGTLLLETPRLAEI